MDKLQLQNIFKSAYNTQTWQQVLHEVFGATELRREPKSLENDGNENVEGFELGRIVTPDHYEIGLYEFEIKAKHKLAMNRVGLRGLVKSFLKFKVEAALVVYYDKNEWRLSFICDLKDEKTAPKRFTYLFGSDAETYRTPIERFTKLIEGKVDFAAIHDAFSVEKLSKEFFKGYKAQYDQFLKYIGSDKKNNRDYVKKLLGRLVFLQFLQKKGWMGVSATNAVGDWNGGDKNYLLNLFKNSEHKDKFLERVLETLFFDTLNNERDDDLANPILGENIRIPYLNGGLFEPDVTDKNATNFPANYFAGLLEFFGQYNFTIDENDPQDAEVGIDPEMLGHIFENLLEDNKDKGAFYTPKEIVRYMCQQSLIEYLQTKLGRHEAIEEFIKTGVFAGRSDRRNFIVANAKAIEHELDSVKICDPAIGSGAFPMGILSEIFKAKMALNLTLDPVEVKKGIIQNSIYGVDIEQGAVDIARLRFWLSLVVDEVVPQPLPNLDYKIMCGNSLLSRFALDTPIDKVFAQYNKEHKTNFTLDSYRNLVWEYTNTASHDKKNEFRKVIEEIKGAFRTELSKKEIEKLSNIRGTISDLEAPMLFGERIKTEKAELKKLKQKLVNLVNNQADILTNKLYENSFEWRFELPCLLDADGSFMGFDIVIGNPPYVQMQLNGGMLSDQLKDVGYETFTRKGDIYCLFYEKGIQILKEGGIECLITSNKWMRAGYGEKLRKYLAENNPLYLIDLGAGIFERATVDTNILVVQRTKNKGEQKAVTLSNVNELKSTENLNFVPLLADINGEVWTITPISERSIKDKIQKHGIPLKDWNIDVYFGVKTGYNEAFIIDSAKRDELVAVDPRSVELIKPLLKGRDIDYYYSKLSEKYIISTFPALEIDIEQYPAILDHLLSFGRRLHQTGELGCRKRTSNAWFETQDQIGYHKELAKEKIVWKRIGSILRFCYDNTGSIVLDSTCFASGENAKFLVAILNSKMGNYLLLDAPKTGTGDLLISVQALEPIRIPKLDKRTQQPFIDVIDKILEAKQSNPKTDTSALEAEIDLMVYELYGLTEDEIAIIEKRKVV